MNTYKIASRKALCNSPNCHLIEKVHLRHFHRLIAWAKFAHFPKYNLSTIRRLGITIIIVCSMIIGAETDGSYRAVSLRVNSLPRMLVNLLQLLLWYTRKIFISRKTC